MERIINYLRLSITDSDEISVIEAKQGDNQGDICQIEIYDNQDIVDLSQFDDILFTANKPDRSSVLFRLSDNKNLIKNNNTLNLTLTDALLSMHGTVECEVSFYKGNIIKSTYNFNIYVFKSPGSFDVMNQSDLTTFKNGINEIRDIKNKVSTSEKNTKLSEENAKVSEINALNSANIANTKANEANNSATEAKTSEINSKNSEIASAKSESNALNYAEQASVSKDAAKTSENNSKKSEQNADTSANTANIKADEASTSATLSKSYAVGGTNTRTNEDVDNSKYYKEQAFLSASNAFDAATNAHNSEINALSSEAKSSSSEANALQYSRNAKLSEDNASDYAGQASISASTASDKADSAIANAKNAESSAKNALSYSEQAKECKGKCMQIAQGLEGALIPMGTIAFENLPTEDIKTGYMYNISNEFTSDERFKDGAVKSYPAGTNIYYTQDEKWDVLVGDLSKYAFKTDFERHQNDKTNPHEVTASQVGLGNVPNVTTNDQTVTYSDIASLAPLSSGEKISTAFGKIKKAISELILHLKDGVKHITSDERTLWNTVKNKADTNHTHGGIDDGANSWTATEIRNHFEGKAKKVHTHTKSDITDFPVSLPANGGTATYANYVYATSHQGSWYQNSQWDGTYFQTNYKNGNNVLPMKVNNAGYADSAGSVAWSNVSGRPSSMPASDVYPWAKASSKPSYTASEVGALEKLSDRTKGIGFNINNNNALCIKIDNSLYELLWANNYSYHVLPLSGGTMKGNIYMNANKIFLYSTTQCIEANDQDVNIISAGKSSGMGYINARTETAFQVRNTSNSAWRAVNALAFNTQSSIKYKKNISNMSDDEAKRLLKYRVITYDYINEDDGVNCEGMIAEEVAEIDEYPVYKTPNGAIEGLDYSKFVPQMIKMIQIQQKEINELKEKVKELIN